MTVCMSNIVEYSTVYFIILHKKLIYVVKKMYFFKNEAKNAKNRNGETFKSIFRYPKKKIEGCRVKIMTCVFFWLQDDCRRQNSFLYSVIWKEPFLRYISTFLYISSNLLISTRRMNLIFLLTQITMLRGALRYLEHVHTVHWKCSRSTWKKVPTQNMRVCQNISTWFWTSFFQNPHFSHFSWHIIRPMRRTVTIVQWYAK